MLSEFAAPGTRVNQLWMGARFVFENRAERSAHYNNPEVHEACVKQLNDLAEYHTKVASAVATDKTKLK
jgi:hypothetical protein